MHAICWTLTAKSLLTFFHYKRPHLEYGSSVYVKNKLGSQIYSLVYKVNVCFIRLENLVYQDNLFIIYTVGQSSIQHTTLCQLNIEKQIFLNVYHFPSTLVLLKYQDLFIECANFESCLSFNFLIWAQNFSTIPFPIQVRSVLELQVSNYLLNIHWLSGPVKCCFNYVSIN